MDNDQNYVTLTISDAQGTVLDQIKVLVAGDREVDAIKTANELRDHIEMKFEVEDDL